MATWCPYGDDMVVSPRIRNRVASLARHELSLTSPSREAVVGGLSRRRRLEEGSRQAPVQIPSASNPADNQDPKAPAERGRAGRSSRPVREIRKQSVETDPIPAG